MPETAQASVTALYRYPVKGLSPDPLRSVACKAGDVLPFDRAYAIENGPSRFDPAAPKYLPKTNFLMLMRDERLATLKTEFDEATETLTVLRDGSSVARGQLSDPTGRRIIEQFFSAYMNFSLRGAPKGRSSRLSQLLRRSGQVRPHRQSGQRSRTRARRRPHGQSIEVPCQHLL